MFVRANFVDIYLLMCDRSMRSGTELARKIKLTDWSMVRNLSNRSSGVQKPRDICTLLKRYLYSAKCSWIIKAHFWFYFITRHECFTAKYTTRQIYTKPHPGLEWRIFHILSCEDIDDFTDIKFVS